MTTAKPPDDKKPDTPAPTPTGKKPVVFAEASLEADRFVVPPTSAPTPEKSMRQLLEEAGFEVLPPKGDGFTIG